MRSAIVRRRPPARHRGCIAVAVTGLVLSACTSTTRSDGSAATTVATTTGGEPIVSAAASTVGSQSPPATDAVPSVPDPLDLLPDDLFTAPPNPLMLVLTTAVDQAASATIGPDGGTITTTDASGTTYTVVVPPNAVPVPLQITMTPTATATGFPADATPQNTLGVVLTPDGLPMAQPAMLTIAPPTPINVAMAVLGADGEGGEAGFQLFQREGAIVQIPLDHFSSYTMEYPVDLPEIRVQARLLQSKLEAELESNAAKILAIDRQKAMLGITDVSSLPDLVKQSLAEFKDKVLGNRLALAPRGCQESEDAISAFTAYERVRQLLGVADDAQFDLKAVKYLVPPTLMDLAIRLCFREAFQFCAKTGDFPGLAIYMFGIFERSKNMLAIEPTPEQIKLADGYLERCGRWHLKIEARGVKDAKLFTQTVDTLSEIDLQWHVGSGSYGILASTIDGADDITPITLEYVVHPCDSAGQVSNVVTKRQASASIDDLAFGRFEGPTPTGAAIPPRPLHLTLHVHFGQLAYDSQTCDSQRGNIVEVFEWAESLVAGTFDLQRLMTDGGEAAVSSGWTFTAQPFSATRSWAGTVAPFSSVTDAKVKLTLDHTPSL